MPGWTLIKIWLRLKQIDFFNNGPLSLILAITYKCQSRCQICSIWKISQNEKSLEKELNFSEYQKIFQQFNKKIYHLTITGGEPFLKKDLVKIIEAAVSELPNLCWISITTNGQTIKTIKILKELLKTFNGNISVEISLDGKQNIHDGIRGVNGSFKTAIKSYKLIKKESTKNKKLSVYFSYTFSEKNAGNIVEFLNDEGIKIKNLNFSIAQNGYLFHQKQKEFDKEIKKKILSDIQQVLNFKNRDWRQIFKRYFLKSSVNFLNNQQKYNCDAGKYSVFIDPYGQTFPCITWNKKIEDFNFQKDNCPNCLTPCEIQFSFLSRFPYNLLVDFPWGHKK